MVSSGSFSSQLLQIVISLINSLLFADRTGRYSTTLLVGFHSCFPNHTRRFKIQSQTLHFPYTWELQGPCATHPHLDPLWLSLSLSSFSIWAVYSGSGLLSFSGFLSWTVFSTFIVSLKHFICCFQRDFSALVLHCSEPGTALAMISSQYQYHTTPGSGPMVRPAVSFKLKSGVLERFCTYKGKSSIKNSYHF